MKADALYLRQETLTTEKTLVLDKIIRPYNFPMRAAGLQKRTYNSIITKIGRQI